jgi:hypothetical protein
MMICPWCNEVDTRVSYAHDPAAGYDVWWCALCEAQWKATFRGEFIQWIQEGR